MFEIFNIVHPLTAFNDRESIEKNMDFVLGHNVIDSLDMS